MDKLQTALELIGVHGTKDVCISCKYYLKEEITIANGWFFPNKEVVIGYKELCNHPNSLYYNSTVRYSHCFTMRCGECGYTGKLYKG